VTRIRSRRSWSAALLLLALLSIVLSACAVQGTPDPSGASPAATASSGAAAVASPTSASPTAGTSPGASASPTATATPAAAKPLEPASLTGNPLDLIATLFTPIFWVLFNILVVFDKVTGNIAIAIILLTLVIRALLIAPFRGQIVSQRRMQLLQPELKELQKKYKGDRNKLLTAQQQFYKERGASPTSGCLPMVLQFGLLIPMYTVISQGLTNFNPQAMTPIDLNCPTEVQYVMVNGKETVKPCLDAVAFGINWGVPEILFTIGIGISVLALISAFLQLIQSRMTLPPADPTNTDPNVRIQRQMVVFIPLISIFYGGILPAGLFLYWIFGTIFSIVQQYLIIGWGSMFPLFGWTPGFAKDHQPRFPVATPPVVVQPGTQPISPSIDRAASAASTIRSRQRGRQGRRGRRR
jgi:YidC/Oxa1 family membrane protein insertase